MTLSKKPTARKTTSRTAQDKARPARMLAKPAGAKSSEEARVDLLRVVLICRAECDIKVKDGASLLWFSIDPASPRAGDKTTLPEDDPIAVVLTEGGRLPPGVYGTEAEHTFTIVGPGFDVLQIYQMNGKNPWPLPPPTKPAIWNGYTTQEFDWEDRWKYFTNGSGNGSVPPISYTFTPTVTAPGKGSAA